MGFKHISYSDILKMKSTGMLIFAVMVVCYTLLKIIFILKIVSHGNDLGNASKNGQKQTIWSILSNRPVFMYVNNDF